MASYIRWISIVVCTFLKISQTFLDAQHIWTCAPATFFFCENMIHCMSRTIYMFPLHCNFFFIAHNDHILVHIFTGAHVPTFNIQHVHQWICLGFIFLICTPVHKPVVHNGCSWTLLHNFLICVLRCFIVHLNACKIIFCFYLWTFLVSQNII